MASLSLMDRLAKGPVVCAEGYLFELERRGFLQAGAFVPEVVLEHPEVVRQLHREFLLAGSDVIEALTYYAHREKLALLGKEDQCEIINRAALRLAKEVATEGDALVAGNICNTNIYDPADSSTKEKVRKMYDEQIGWAVDEGVDFIIAETIAFLGEAEIALEAIKAAGATSVVTLAIHKEGTMRDGASAVEACKRLKDMGADVVGLNCTRGPDTILPLMREIAKEVDGPLASLPVPYRTSESQPTFQSLADEKSASSPTGMAFPSGLDPFMCTRFEMAEFAKEALELGYHYLGICCGAGPHHIRSLSEALGKAPMAGRYSPDMSKHYAFGKNERFKEHNQQYAEKL